MNKTFAVILGGALAILILSFLLPGYLVPTDILYTIPSFSTSEWIRAHNSLIADPLFQFEPWRHFAKQELLSGRFPLWNDENSFGAPFFANPQTAVLYPLNFLYYLLPTGPALYAIHLYKLYFLGVFSFFYFREIIKDRFLALFGGIAVACTAFPLVWLLWPHTNVFLFFPLLLFFTEKIRTNSTSYWWNIGISITYCMAIFAGHPETLFHMTIIHGVYSIVRLWKQNTKLIYLFAAILVGFLLGAVQLIPFAEYLLHSYSFEARSTTAYNYYLPLFGFVLNIFPFILGAPHVSFYKPITLYTNFQETISGYVGFGMLLISLYGGLRFWKVALIRLWSLLIIVCWMVAYAIWPMTYLFKLPIVHSSDNSRILAFAAFGLITIGMFTLQKLFLQKRLGNANAIYIFLASLALLAVGLDGVYFIASHHFKSNPQIIKFLPFLFSHILFICLTTAGIMWSAFGVFSNHFDFLRKFILVICFFLQTGLLFWNYNTITSQENYYPKTKLTKELFMVPKGAAIETGNPNFSQNLNLMYGMYHAENYDALQINSYQALFDAILPLKNNWKKVDAISVTKLADLRIAYVVSDYDINQKRIIVNTTFDSVLQPITANNSYHIPFIPIQPHVEGIRLLTANFNRYNTCLLHITLQETDNKHQLFSRQIPCSSIRDHMYVNIPMSVSLSSHKQYDVVVSATNTSSVNAVALLGNNANQPYFEVFYQHPKNQARFPLLYSDGTTYLWKVPGVRQEYFNGQYKLLSETPEQSTLLVNSSGSIISVNRVAYPGWKVAIDGNLVKLADGALFLQTHVPKGQHIVRFYYRPLSFYIGLSISVLTFCGLLLFAFMKFYHFDFKKIK